jgi:hypothetical protein
MKDFDERATGMGRQEVRCNLRLLMMSELDVV